MYPTARQPYSGIFVRRHQEEFARLRIQNDLVAPRGESGGRIAVLGKYLGLLVRSLATAMRRRYDLIHAHNLFPTGLIGWLASRMRGSALVVTSHGSDIHFFPARGAVHRWLTGRALKCADCVIAVSDDLKAVMVRDFGVDPSKVTVNDMGVSTDEFAVRSKEEEKRSLGLPSGQVVVLFVGVKLESKGAPLLLDAVARLRDRWNPDSHVYLIGGHSLEEYRRRIERDDMQGQVTLLGILPPEVARGWIRAADIFVLPTYREGMPVSVMEAMAAGCAVLCSRVGGVPHLIDSGRDGILVPPGSVEETADALARLVAEPDLRQRMASSAQQRIREFDTSRKVKKILSVYRDVLARGAPGKGG
jgi:glycosyltransferase involved in cell wall biosynthesis